MSKVFSFTCNHHSHSKIKLKEHHMHEGAFNYMFKIVIISDSEVEKQSSTSN
jgi:protein-disulfide isomerase